MTTLQDKIYGKMYWYLDTDCWSCLIDDDEYGEYDLYIRVDSQMNLFAVRNTHKTHERLMINLDSIINTAAQQILKNTGKYNDKKERKAYGEVFQSSLYLSSMTINADLSSEIYLISSVWEDEDLDQEIHILLNPNGVLTDAHID